MEDVTVKYTQNTLKLMNTLKNKITLLEECVNPVKQTDQVDNF